MRMKPCVLHFMGDLRDFHRSFLLNEIGFSVLPHIVKVLFGAFSSYSFPSKGTPRAQAVSGVVSCFLRV